MEKVYCVGVSGGDGSFGNKFGYEAFVCMKLQMGSENF
jgi:hypothetical protein